MYLTDKKHHNLRLFELLVFGMSMMFLSGCQYAFSPQNISPIEIEVAKQSVNKDFFDEATVKSLDFIKFNNNDKVDFSKSQDNIVFRITQINSTDIENALLIMPHYFSRVLYFDESFQLKDSFERNTYKAHRNYSPNVTAFNDVGKVSYILIENQTSKPLYFSIEEKVRIKSYDQKLLMTFTMVDSIILTLVLIHLVFYFFTRKLGYLLYSLYIFSVLFSTLFQEGMISYFPTLSSPVFGDYTQVIWLKITSVLYWMFTLVFLDLKSRSKFDYNLARIMMILEAVIVFVLLLLFFFDISGVYAYLAKAINLFFIIGIMIAIYIPVKYALLKVRQAQYLAIGFLVHMITVLMRVKYSTTLEPLAFWMPRAFEFGLMFEAIILSFGLADKTMRVISQRDVAEKKIKRVDRELFCKQLEKNFLQRTINTIDKYDGNQSELNGLIRSYFISSLQQLVEAKDVFYVSQNNNKIEFQLISGNKIDFDINGYIAGNRKLMNEICDSNTTSFQKNELKNFSQLPFVIIPIVEKDRDNLCLFLTFPSYVEVSNNIIQDLTIFANTMTLSLLTVKKYQKTVESSRYDNLTHVLNRETIQSKLDVLLSESNNINRSVSVAFIDLDDFKGINDKYGHAIGDECLIFLCDKLKEVFNRDAFVGRYGGDEFLVVFNQYSGVEIENKFKLLYECFSNNYVQGIELSISVGLAMKQNHPLLNGKELLQKADSALYRAKENGKSQLVFD